MRWLYPLLIFVPISIVQYFMHVSPVWLFLSSCLSIIPLAGVMGVATEEYSKYRGQAIGGLLNATFGNATELIIAIVAVFNGKVEIVRASLIGSIIGNLLLVFGLATLLGGLKFKEQKFNRHSAEANGSMMTISVISLLVPAIFIHNSHLKDSAPSVANLSLAVAVLLIALYIGGLIFSLISHKSFFQDEVKHTEKTKEEEEEEKPTMSQAKALGILLLSTLFIAFESEFLVSSIEPVVHKLHMSELFLGIILIPIIGNAAEHSTAVVMAVKNKMDISVNIAISSAAQIAMFVAPLIIIVSRWSHHPVTIVFSSVELICVAAAVMITQQVTRDGKTNWLEGAQLLAAYIIMALAFFFIPG